MSKSKIEWTEVTWSPITGCSAISSGCKHCYARKMTKRLKAMGIKKYQYGFDNVLFHEEELEKIYKLKKPRMIFVNSMSDTFHDKITCAERIKIFNAMQDNPRHVYQVLTKRAYNMEKFDIETDIFNHNQNFWLGVTVESTSAKSRIDKLRRTGASVKFISFEPLLQDVGEVNLDGIDWVIVGGESGPKCRPMKAEWVRSLRDQCLKQNIPFFFKQWGGVNKKKAGNKLDGKVWNEWPEFSNNR